MSTVFNRAISPVPGETLSVDRLTGNRTIRRETFAKRAPNIPTASLPGSYDPILITRDPRRFALTNKHARTITRASSSVKQTGLNRNGLFELHALLVQISHQIIDL